MYQHYSNAIVNVLQLTREVLAYKDTSGEKTNFIALTFGGVLLLLGSLLVLQCLSSVEEHPGNYISYHHLSQELPLKNTI